MDLHIEAKLLPCKYRRLIMLQKNTFRELQDNLAKIDRRDVCTRAHDATLIHATRPKSDLIRNLTVITELLYGLIYLFILGR